MLLVPAGLFGWRAWKAPTRNRAALWLTAIVVWALVVGVLVQLSLRSDPFSISSTALGVGGAVALVWRVLGRTTLKRRGIWLALLAAWLAVSAPLMWKFDAPYVTFEVATIRCGHQPVIATNFAAAYTYDLPGDHGYGPSVLTDTYYCSAADAEAAGYRRLPTHSR